MIDTFRKLVESGDRVLRVEGCVSGTLGFVLSALESGASFSAAVREAVARGYAEPDPRDDLSGADALRKGLILSRLLGYAGLSPHAESLVPRGLASLSLERFLERLPEHDAAWRRRVAVEAARGRVLRYVVVATARGRPRRAQGRAARLGHRRSRRHAQPAVVYDSPLPEGASRRGRSRGRARGHGGRHPERHPGARERVARSAHERSDPPAMMVS